MDVTRISVIVMLMEFLPVYIDGELNIDMALEHSGRLNVNTRQFATQWKHCWYTRILQRIFCRT